MSRVKNGFVIAMLVVFGGAPVDGQIDVPPLLDSNLQVDAGRLQPNFKRHPTTQPLIDDVVRPALHGSQPGEKASSAIRRCQLNAPLSSNPEDSSDDTEKPKEAMVVSGWVVSKSAHPKKLLIMQTPNIEIQSELPCCDSCELNGRTCLGSDNSPLKLTNQEDKQAINDYCDEVSKALVTTIHGSRDNPQAQQRAIEAALRLVAAKVAEHPVEKVRSGNPSVAQTEVEVNLPNQGWREYLPKQNQASHVAAQSADAQLAKRALLEPVYAAQYRQSAQLKRLVENNQQIVNSILNLEKKFASFAMMQQAKLKGSEVRRMMNSIEEDEVRERELALLQAQVKVLDERIGELLSNPLRQANHLEPIYSPDQTLRPIRPSQR